MSVQEVVQKQRRLSILELLKEADGYTASSSFLYAALPGQGFDLAMDTLEDEIVYLKHALLVTKDDDLRDFVTLTQEGLDVVLGKIKHAGVARPLPKFRQ